MEKKTIFIWIILLIIAVFLGYKLYKGDLGIKKIPEDFSNISISAEYNNQKIKTGYILTTIDGKIEGNTSQSYEKQIAKKNTQITIQNKNIEDQLFYEEKIEYNLNQDTLRIDLQLKEPKPLQVKTKGTRPIEITLKSEYIKNLDFCLRWTLNYIFVEPTHEVEFVNLTNKKDNVILPISEFNESKYREYTKIYFKENVKFDTKNKFKGYEKYDKCYKAGYSFDNSEQSFNVSYNIFSTLKEDDFIEIAFIEEEFLGKTDKVMKIR